MDPGIGVRFIFSHMLAVVIHGADNILGAGIAIAGGPVQPFIGLFHVHLAEPAEIMKRAQVALSPHMAFFGRPQIIFFSLFVVPLHSAAHAIELTEVIERIRIAQGGVGQPFFPGAHVVSGFIG